MWSILENVPCALEKKLYSFAFGWNVLKISMRSISSKVSYKTWVSLLILFSWSAHWCEWGVKVSYYYCVTVNFSFYVLVFNFFMYWGTPILDACCCQVTSVVSNSVQPHRWQPTRFPCPWDSPGKNTGVGCHFLLQCMKLKSESEVTQSCLILSDPMDCSPPGSSVHGIFQARVLEWGAIAFSIKTPSRVLNTNTRDWNLDRFSHCCQKLNAGHYFFLSPFIYLTLFLSQVPHCNILAHI